MAAELFHLKTQRIIDTNGIADGATLTFYDTGTLTKRAVYTTEALSVEHPNPLTVASGAALPNIYLNNAYTYRCIVRDAVGNTIDDLDPYTGFSTAGISYNDGGTDAVDTTVQALLRSLPVYVTAYGADPTGATDSLAAIQAAKTAANAAARPLVFPDGAYLVSDTLDLAFFEGEVLGLGSCFIISTDDSVSPIVRVDGSTTASVNMRIENIQIKGSAGAQTGLHVIEGHCSTFRNIIVRDCGTNGFRLDGCVFAIFESCHVVERGRTVTVNPDNGFLIQDASGVSSSNCCYFFNCVVECADVRGWYIYKANDCIWIGGSSEGIDGIGVVIDTTSQRNTFINFFCELNTTGGDFVIYGDSNRLLNCTVSSRAASPPYEDVKSLIFESGAENNAVQGGLAYAVEVKSGALNTRFEGLTCDYRIDDSGTGTIVGSGIKQTNLSATRQAGTTLGNIASSNANTLDWYQEHDFTVTIGGSTTNGDVVLSKDAGRGTRIGNRFFGSVTVQTSTINSAPTGDLLVRGLPYSCKTGVNAPCSLGQFTGLTYTGRLSAVVVASVNYIRFPVANGTSASILAGSGLGSGTFIEIGFSYEVA